MINEGLDPTNFMNDLLEMTYFILQKKNLGNFDSDLSITEMELETIDLISKNINISTLIDHYEGKKLNSPNDVCVKSDDTIWFTDPPYGILSDYEGIPGKNEYGGNYVFKFNPQKNKLDVTLVNKVKEGSPHIVDSLLLGKINLVINTTKTQNSLRDSYSIRRTSLMSNIPYYTTMARAKVAVDAIEILKKNNLTVRSLLSIH